MDGKSGDKLRNAAMVKCDALNSAILQARFSGMIVNTVLKSPHKIEQQVA